MSRMKILIHINKKGPIQGPFYYPLKSGYCFTNLLTTDSQFALQINFTR